MSYDLRLHAIAKKYNGEFGAVSVTFAMAIGSTVTTTITCPQGYVVYMLKHGGYSSTGDVLVEFKINNDLLLFDWEEYPDTSFEEYSLPFHQHYFKDNFKVVFTNNSGSSPNILLKISFLLIPETLKEAFEKEIERTAK